MLAGGREASALARDTIYSAVMIIANGVIGVCILIGGLQHREQNFRIEGMGAGFAALATLSVLVLVMPSLTTTVAGPAYSTSQLLFVALSSGCLWLIFVFVQTVRHRDYFLPSLKVEDESVHAPAPSARQAWLSVLMLVLALLALTFLVGSITLASGRTFMMHGAIHLVLFAAFLFLTLVP
jgi:Ca2+:H+ antiporter